jgi:hypothetical protein
MKYYFKSHLAQLLPGRLQNCSTHHNTHKFHRLHRTIASEDQKRLHEHL